MDRRDFTKAFVAVSAAFIAEQPLWACFSKPNIKLVGVGTAGYLAIKGLCDKLSDVPTFLAISREASDLNRVVSENRIFLQPMELGNVHILSDCRP